MSVKSATERAVKEARAQGLITAADGGTVAALLHVATEIDSLKAGVNAAGKLDNVSVPTYLKYSDALGLTPTSRKRMQAAIAKAAGTRPDRAAPVKEGAGDSDSKLAGLRAVAGRE